jgi:hypothetical protein
MLARRTPSACPGLQSPCQHSHRPALLLTPCILPCRGLCCILLCLVSFAGFGLGCCNTCLLGCRGRGRSASCCCCSWTWFRPLLALPHRCCWHRGCREQASAAGALALAPVQHVRAIPELKTCRASFKIGTSTYVSSACPCAAAMLNMGLPWLSAAEQQTLLASLQHGLQPL